MEFDELKPIWQELNRSLEQQSVLKLHLLEENTLKASRGLRPLVWGQTIQIIAGVLLAIWSGSYWVDHRDNLPLMICGLSIHGYGLMLSLCAARTLYLIQCIDFAAPVLGIQKKLATLRAWNIRNGLWFGGVGCFMWIPFALIALQSDAATGGTIQTHRLMYWLIANIFVCLALLLALVFGLRRWLPKVARRLEESSIGRGVRQVELRLDEITRFERD